MKNLKLFAAFLSLFSILFMVSCEKEEGPGTVRLFLDHSINGDAITLENKAYLSPAGHPFYVYRLKYYISEIALYDENGTSIKFDNIHYRDILDETTRMVDLGEVPEGDYERITFTFGLEEAINVDGGLPNTQTNVNMEWPIPGDQGYHYMKFEGRYDSLGTGVLKNFNLHTGATGGNQNYIEISLPISEIDINENLWSVMIEMDLMEWLKSPHIYDFDEFGPMIMMNQQAQTLLKENGQTVFSITNIIEE